ncbi:MAG: WbqC family protein [Bacteroidetes bacterium]|nr:WbqC family protein [Bacteroidota bacterium]
MNHHKSILLPIFYLPPISWFAYFFQTDFSVKLEQQESFLKQTFRNRTEIYGANGKLTLSIPIQKPGRKKINEVQMSFAENWKAQHWKSIVSAYKNAPYFEYYQDELRKIYQLETENLMEFNLNGLQIILKILKSSVDYQLTQDYQFQSEDWDGRSFFSPKTDTNLSFDSYYQVFSDKGGFLKNLSILDLICNKGPESLTYIKKIKLIM